MLELQFQHSLPQQSSYFLGRHVHSVPLHAIIFPNIQVNIHGIPD